MSNPFHLLYLGNWVTRISDFSPRNSPILPIVEYDWVCTLSQEPDHPDYRVSIHDLSSIQIPTVIIFHAAPPFYEWFLLFSFKKSSLNASVSFKVLQSLKQLLIPPPCILIRYNVYSQQHTITGWNIQPLTKYSTQEMVKIHHLRQSRSKLRKVN